MRVFWPVLMSTLSTKSRGAFCAYSGWYCVPERKTAPTAAAAARERGRVHPLAHDRVPLGGRREVHVMDLARVVARRADEQRLGVVGPGERADRALGFVEPRRVARAEGREPLHHALSACRGATGPAGRAGPADP